jgi:hypothetical protein
MTNWSKINIPITGKLVTKKNLAQYSINELERIENWYIDTEKQLKKREQWAKVGSYSNLDRLFASSDELLLTDQNSLYSYSSKLDDLVYRGHLKKLKLEKRPIAQQIDSYYSPQTCTNSDLEACVYLDKNSYLYLTVLDRSTNAQLVSSSLLISSAVSRPQISEYNKNFYITFTYNDKLWLIVYNGRTNSIGNVTEIVDLDSSNCYSLSNMIVAYIDTSSQLSLLNLLAPATQIQFNHFPLLLNLNGNVLSFITSTEVYSYIVSPELQLSSEIAVILSNIAPTDCTQIVGDTSTIWLEEVPTSTPYIYKIDLTVNVPTDTLVLLNHYIVSDSFNSNIILLPNINDQGSYIAIDPELNIEAIIIPEAAGSYTNSYNATGTELLEIGYVSKPSNSVVALREKTRIESENGELYTEKGIVSVTLEPSLDYFSTLQTDNLLINTGSILKQYDGSRLLEIGFTQYPEFIGAPVIQASGSIDIGTYAYCLVYEALDNKGNIIRSAPSIYTSVSIVADNSKVTFTTPSIQLSGFSSIKLCLYRTENLGQIFYKVADVDNDSTIVSQTITDSLVDSDIVSREMLYTVGGTYENSFPPAPKFIQKFQNRVFLVSAENPNKLFYSKKIKSYKEAIAFTQYNVIELQKDETITALANLDDKLIIFTKGSIKILVGDGPADNGTGDQYQYPYSLTISVGTSNQNSICKFRDGILFQSDDGFFLLNRGLQISEIGESVKLYKNWQVLQTLVREDKQLIRILLEKNTVLVYSFEYNRWSVFKDLPIIESECLSNGKLYGLGNSQLLVEETSDENVKAIWESGWVQLDINKQGFFRVKKALLLFNCKSTKTSNFKVEVLYDFEKSPREEFDFTIDRSLPYGSEQSPYGGEKNIQREFNFKYQKCQAFKIRITEQSRSSEVNIQALTLEVGDMGGLNRVATSQKVRGE